LWLFAFGCGSLGLRRGQCCRPCVQIFGGSLCGAGVLGQQEPFRLRRHCHVSFPGPGLHPMVQSLDSKCDRSRGPGNTRQSWGAGWPVSRRGPLRPWSPLLLLRAEPLPLQSGGAGWRGAGVSPLVCYLRTEPPRGVGAPELRPSFPPWRGLAGQSCLGLLPVGSNEFDVFSGEANVM
jgi:hypothetical protein